MASVLLNSSVYANDIKTGVLSALDYLQRRPGHPTLTMTIRRVKSGGYFADIVITESSADTETPVSSEGQQTT